MGAGMSRGRMLPVLALHALAEYARSDAKPPVTAALVLANLLLFLRWPPLLNRLLPDLRRVAFNPYLVLKNRDLRRFLLSPLYHTGESHLVYNMTSLLWKGVQLENYMGSLEFAGMVATILVFSQGITLLLAKSLLLVFEYETAYYYEYAVGFSGVLFGLKVVLNSHFSDNFTYVQGILVPTRYAAWMELILIQLFVPGVSFLGHLGGILAGIAYLRLRSSIGQGSDPLAVLVGGTASVLSWPFRAIQRLLRRRPGSSGRGNYVGDGRSGNRGISGGGFWRCPTCTYDNSAWSDICEMCSTARPSHVFSTRSTPVRPTGISLEELRRRRLDRFDR